MQEGHAGGNKLNALLPLEAHEELDLEQCKLKLTLLAEENQVCCLT